MPTRHLSNTALYTLHLMSAALRNTAAMDIPQGASWEQVFKAASSNSVATICAFAANDTSQPWQAEVDKNLYRIVSFEVQRMEIFAAMEQEGLSYLPLKGAVLKDLYPRPEMRWMCDNDILYGQVKPCKNGGFEAQNTDDSMAKMRQIMESHGFKTVHYGAGNHDSFEKQPFYNFEMHRGLANPEVDWWQYYENPWSRAKQTATSHFAYEFSHEDVYLFHIAHTHKHFANAGCGVRCIADEWVLLNAWGNVLDWNYITAELNKLGMLEFEQQLKALAQAVLEDDVYGKALAGKPETLSSSNEALLAYMLGSGTYGTTQNSVKNKLVKEKGEGVSAKARYLLHRAFPKPESIKLGYPIVSEHPWMLPAVYVYRLIVLPFAHAKKLSAELKAVAEYSDTSVREETPSE